jgi:hypothetical protein
MRNEPGPLWDNPPLSDAEPIEISFTIGESHFVGLLIDDPNDPQIGYDTLAVATERNGSDVKVRLKPASPSVSGEFFLERTRKRQNGSWPRSQELFPPVRPQA